MAVTDHILSKSIISICNGMYIFLKEFPFSLFLESKITFGKYELVAVTDQEGHNFPFCLVIP